MVEKIILVECEVVAALALVYVVPVGSDVILILLSVTALEVTLRTLQTFQIGLGGLDTCKSINRILV